MKYSIHIIHTQPNRLRIKFSTSVLHPSIMSEMVKEHKGVNTFSYNPITQTALICFNSQKIDSQEVLIRTAVAYSAENKLVPIKIMQHDNKTPITPQGIIAGTSILVAAISSFMPPLSRFSNLLKWTAAISTGAAVIEHAGIDFRKKGSVDPEVISVVYLANQVLNAQKFLLPSALTWIATFGRHLSKRDQEGVTLEIRKVDTEDNEVCYEIFISKLNSKANIIEILNSLASNMVSVPSAARNSIYEGSKNLLKKHDKTLEGIGKQVNNIVLTFKN